MYPAQQGYRTLDSETRAGSICKSSARDAAKSPNVIMRRPHLVLFASADCAGSCSGLRSRPGIGIGRGARLGRCAADWREVQLLRPDLSVIASVYTNSQGRFSIPSVLPGRYAVKAMGTSFLPSLRENVRVRTSTVVNLTLNTLYEVMQWLPSEPRAGDGSRTIGSGRCVRPRTVRCCAGSKMVRWSWFPTARAAAPKLKARLMATGQEGTFGESGERFSAAVKIRRPTAANCWRAWILRRTPMPAWSRCWASARIWDLPARCSRSLRLRFIRR